jgi:hypothetical protein
MNQRNLKALAILLILIFTLNSCKKKSSVKPGGYVPPTSNVPPGSYVPPVTGGGYWDPTNFSSGSACWTWVGTGTPNPTSPAAPTVAGSGTWNWYASSKCWYWYGYGTPPTPTKPSSSKPPDYNYLPGQSDPNANSDCYAKGISNGGSGSLPYYRITAIGHGNPGGLAWSSSSLSSGDQQILTTDSRFNVRVVAKASPPKGTKDYKGVTCNYEGIAFSKVKLTIGLRKPNSNYYTSTYDISGIPVGKCSDVYEFTDYQIPVTSGPIVLDILNFQSDYWCRTYEGTKYAGNPAYCPYVALYANDCFSIEVQFATDFTLDIPH